MGFWGHPLRGFCWIGFMFWGQGFTFLWPGFAAKDDWFSGRDGRLDWIRGGRCQINLGNHFA